MEVELVVSTDCQPCRVAEETWSRACAARGVNYTCVDISSPRGDQLRDVLDLRSVPAVVLDGRLVAIGVQTPAEVEALLTDRAP